MDISVSRLNNRMTLQVPPELPLGLVFITGRVGELSSASLIEGEMLVAFTLHDEQYRLACRIPPQVIEETQITSGDRIRVSGHLLFDARSVHYYLLARDLEVLAGATPDPAVRALPAERRRAQATSLAQGDLPPWVRQLAPREIQAELGLLPQPAKMGGSAAPGAPPPSAAAEDQISPEMLAFLSNAIDSADDIELTHAMIQDYVADEPAASSPPRQRDRTRRVPARADVPDRPVAGDEGKRTRASRRTPAVAGSREGSALDSPPPSPGAEVSKSAEVSLAFLGTTLFLLFLFIVLLALALFLWNNLGAATVGQSAWLGL